jgi:hypothetical protein
MSPAHGFFYPPGDGGSAGFVRARVGIPRARRVLPIVFKIDTGSRFSLLLDADFLEAVNAVAYPLNFPFGAHALHWIASRPDVFARTDDAWSLGGVTKCYLLKFSWIWLCDKRGGMSASSAPMGPLYGAFSYGFLNPPGPICRSLMGRNVLNCLTRMVWARPRSLLTLQP